MTLRFMTCCQLDKHIWVTFYGDSEECSGTDALVILRQSVAGFVFAVLAGGVVGTGFSL